MLFNSLDFWLYLPAVLLIYQIMPSSNPRGRQWVLLLASYGFYAAWDARFLGLILLSTAVDFYAALQIPKSNRPKVWVSLSLVVNLGLLFAFKYAGFFVESAVELLQALHLPVAPVALKIILPLGISFYTFQTIGYTIDVYRQRIQPEPNALNFALFVAFFPQLMAGPIERARDLIPQLQALSRTNKADLLSGFRLFVLGMVKKVCISGLIWEHAELLYLNPEVHGPGETWFLGSLMLVHILMDFSGYSDMAVGLGRMFGVRLSRNFNRIFLAQNLPDLWQRWHMTLGRWFRDYLLLPLHRSGIPKHVAVLITFTLIGLWHGAQGTFIVWGLIMGCLWLLDSKSNWQRRLTHLLPFSPFWARLMTIGLFVLSSQLFACDNTLDALHIVKTMIGAQDATSLPFHPIPRSIWFALALFAAIEFGLPRLQGLSSKHLRWAIGYRISQQLFFLPFGIMCCAEGLWTSNEFVYFQF